MIYRDFVFLVVMILFDDYAPYCHTLSYVLILSRDTYIYDSS